MVAAQARYHSDHLQCTIKEYLFRNITNLSCLNCILRGRHLATDGLKLSYSLSGAVLGDVLHGVPWNCHNNVISLNTFILLKE